MVKLMVGLQILFGGVVSAQTVNKVIFKDDFGTSSKERIASQYIPQTGKDTNLGSASFTHGSKFYKLAMPPYKDDEDKGFSWNIDNGYYGIIAPKYIYSLEKPAGIWVGAWWKNIQDHTNTDPEGAVLVINGGSVLNQFYRRGVTLEKNKTYRISAWVYGSGNKNVSIKFETQHITTEEVLGSSKANPIGESNKWVKMQWDFKVPNNEGCTAMAIALRNAVSSDSGNDFYIDDIVLEQVDVTSSTELKCSDSSVVEGVIKAANDQYVWGKSSYTILANDQLNSKTGAENFIFSGVNKNATIATIGDWPNGVSIDALTGKLIVEPGAFFPKEPLVYNICNLLGVCSSAKVTFTYPAVLAEYDSGKGEAGEVAKDLNGMELSIYKNDLLNGLPFSTLPKNYTFTKSDPNNYFTVDSLTGKVTINSGTPNGSHAFNYTICNSTGQCDDANVVIKVGAIDTLPDIYNASQLMDKNVLSNDSYNGIVIGSSISDFTVSQVGDKNGVKVNSNGTVTTTNTIPGEYITHYQVRDKNGKVSNVEKVTVYVSGFKAYDDVFEIDKPDLINEKVFNVFANDYYYYSASSKLNVSTNSVWKWVYVNDGKGFNDWSGYSVLDVDYYNEQTATWIRLDTTSANRYFKFNSGELRTQANTATVGAFTVKIDALPGKFRISYKARYETANKESFSTAYVYVTIKDNLFQGTICVKPGTAGQPKGYSMTGVSTQETQKKNWPTTIPNGFLALESTNKGMVITRTTSDRITTPVEGMIIYDIQDKCVKLYNGKVWSCIHKSCND